MSHVIDFTAADDAPTGEVAAELEQLLESCTGAVAEHLTQPDLSRSALLLKRSRVRLPRFEGRWFVTGRDQERLGELINVLAEVARTVDALHYLADDLGSLADVTPREQEVLRLVADGMNDSENADHLTIGVSTVKSHVSSLPAQLGLRDREHLIVFAHRERSR